MVLFFTQTRGTLAGMELEQTLDQLLIQGDVSGFREQRAARADNAGNFVPYEGLYWDEDNVSAYYVVQAHGDRLMIERPGAFSKALVPTETPGHFALEGSSRVLEFEPPTDGQSAAFLFPFSNRVERQVRHRPGTDPDLPSLDSILAGLHRAHGLDAQDDVGIVRMLGSIEMKARGLKGRVVLMFDRHRLRAKYTMGENTENVWITADDRVYSRVADGEVTELDGIKREQALADHPLRRYADWRARYESVDVLRHITPGDKSLLLVRTVPTFGSGSTKFIDPESGLLAGEHLFEDVPGIGRLGLRVDYGDFRDVGGLTLPFLIRSKYSSALLGELVIRFERADTNVDGEVSLKPPVDD